MKYPLLFAVILLASCSSGGGKKVLVESSGDIEIKGNTITLTPGGSHKETVLVPDGDSVVVVSPKGTQGFSVKEPGFYLLNIKKDTMVGSYQKTGSDNSRTVITEADLINRMDSLHALMAGTNVSEAARNYNIPPFDIKLITKNTDAQIIGPYLHIPGSFDPSKEHEVYKFFTNKEIAATAENLKKMVSGKKEKEN